MDWQTPQSSSERSHSIDHARVRPAVQLRVGLHCVRRLGAGTGLCGMACAALGASVTLTDLSEALPLLRQNSEACLWASRVETCELNWSQQLVIPGAFDLAVACDCLYRPADYPALADTLTALGAPALIAWRQRERNEAHFLELLSARGFTIVEVSGVDVNKDAQVRLVRATPLQRASGTASAGIYDLATIPAVART